MVWRPMLSCFRGICQVAPMSRLRFFIGKYNLLKLRIDLKAVVYIPICCLNPHFFFLFLFILELCCRIFSARDVFLGHGSFSWITQSSMFNFHSLLYQLNFVSISCVFFFSFLIAQGKQKQIRAGFPEVSCWLWVVWAYLSQLPSCWSHTLWHWPIVQQDSSLDER